MIETLLGIIDPQKIIAATGLIGVIAVIFAETGLLIGFFLPGDSLLFTAGFIASQGLLPIWPLLIGTFIAAVVGDSVGYWFGKKTGPALFNREDSRFFKKAYLTRTQSFYVKHGKKTIILARFMPIIRTFAPIMAGIGLMDYRTFITYNIVGGFVWTVGITLAGFFLGKLIPDVDKYLLPIILLIIFISFLPGIFHFIQERKNAKNVVQ
jgi:membrane-associated protein